MNKVNVLVVDDHLQILDAIQNILNAHPATGHVDTFSDGFSAYANIPKKLYDICIIDLRLPRMDGFALIEQIRKTNPTAKIIINTMCEELWDVKRILELDVHGIVIKTSSLAHLKKAIDTVLAGNKYFCPKFQQLEKQHIIGVNVQLSEREIDVLKAIAEGLTSAEISLQQAISENTVESIRKRLLLKMYARNMAHLISKAHKSGIITNYQTDTPPD
jgi:DNA-binding NarL/FixJ family response regulator